MHSTDYQTLLHTLETANEAVDALETTVFCDRLTYRHNRKALRQYRFARRRLLARIELEDRKMQLRELARKGKAKLPKLPYRIRIEKR